MTIFKCAEDAETRAFVRSCNGLEPLVKLLGMTSATYVGARQGQAVFRGLLILR
jgi:hypothetical protein